MPPHHFEWTFEPGEWRDKFLLGFSSRFEASKVGLVTDTFRESVGEGVKRVAEILHLISYRGTVRSAFKDERALFGTLPDTDEKIRRHVKAETLLMLSRSLEGWWCRVEDHHPLMKSIGIRFLFEAMKIKKTDEGFSMSRLMDRLVEDTHRAVQEHGDGLLCLYVNLY